LALPGEISGTATSSAALGRWWIRGCEFGTIDGELHVSLRGPAWFWVEHDTPPFRLRQYVYARIRAELSGRLDPRVGFRDGVVSFRLEPMRSSVVVEPVGDIRPRPSGAWASVLRVLAAPLPTLNVDDQVRERLRSAAVRRFQVALQSGATIVYDMARDQPDFALGSLPDGVVPEHPFDDGLPWLANERIAAIDGGVHVLGPFPSQQALALDADLTRGAGVAWRAVCAADLERAFAGVEHGEPGRITAAESRYGGRKRGRGGELLDRARVYVTARR
jgi:hypothetical protein